LSPAGDISRELPIAKRSPAMTKVFEALRDAVGGGRDLVGVDRIQLLARRPRIPEHQRRTTNEAGAAERHFVTGSRARQVLQGHPGLQHGGASDLHNVSILAG
jgi:hypothetical protein